MMESFNGPPKDATEEQLSEYLRNLCSDLTLQSRKEGFFAKWLDQVKANLSGNFMQHFIKLTTDEERIIFVWNITPLHTLGIQRFYKRKDSELSEEKRNSGNLAFQRKEYQTALAMYSQAVIKAPNSGNYLSYAYANRSAVLFHLKKYSYCLEDIGLALVHGYPEDLHYKIHERRASCWQRQGNFTKALEEFKTASEKLKTANLDIKKKADWVKTLKSKIEECTDKEDRQIKAEKDDREPFLGGPAPKMQLFKGPSKIFPNGSEAIGVEFSPELGRYAVAQTDIPSGQLLVSEEPFAAALSPERFGGHCLHCGFRLIAPLPCSNCAGVAFCSTACRDAAMPYHKYECEYSDLLFASGMSLNCYLALRMITQKPLNYFMDMKSELPNIQNTPTVDKPMEADSYKSIYNLVALDKQRDPFDFLQRTLMAVFLLKVLQRAHYFGSFDETESPDANLKDDELHIGALLLKNLQVIQFNAHELSGVIFYGDTKKLPFRSSKSLYLGLAVYPTVSIFNHGCFPSVTRHFNGRRMSMISLRPIKKGEQICENYGPIFTHHSKADRQAKLKSRYWFDCTCEPCTKNWPTYQEMANPIVLKCVKCQEPLPPSATMTSNKNAVNCELCGARFNAEQLMKKILQVQKCYKDAKENFDNGCREDAIKLMQIYVEMANNLYALPHKDLHLAQEALRLLIAARGTSYALEAK